MLRWWPSVSGCYEAYPLATHRSNAEPEVAYIDKDVRGLQRVGHCTSTRLINVQKLDTICLGNFMYIRFTEGYTMRCVYGYVYVRGEQCDITEVGDEDPQPYYLNTSAINEVIVEGTRYFPVHPNSIPR